MATPLGFGFPFSSSTGGGSPDVAAVAAAARTIALSIPAARAPIATVVTLDRPIRHSSVGALPTRHPNPSQQRCRPARRFMRGVEPEAGRPVLVKRPPGDELRATYRLQL